MQNFFFNPCASTPQMARDKVASFEEAKRYQVYPGSVVYLLDSEEPYIYRTTADQNGTCSIRAFSLDEVDTSTLGDGKYITRDDFDSFKKELLDSIKNRRGNDNGKSFAQQKRRED